MDKVILLNQIIIMRALLFDAESSCNSSKRKSHIVNSLKEQIEFAENYLRNLL